MGVDCFRFFLSFSFFLNKRSRVFSSSLAASFFFPRPVAPVASVAALGISESCFLPFVQLDSCKTSDRSSRRIEPHQIPARACRGGRREETRPSVATCTRKNNCFGEPSPFFVFASLFASIHHRLSLLLTVMPGLGRRLLQPVQLPDVRRPRRVRYALVQAVHRQLRVDDGLAVGLVVLGRGLAAKKKLRHDE